MILFPRLYPSNGLWGNCIDSRGALTKVRGHGGDGGESGQVVGLEKFLEAPFRLSLDTRAWGGGLLSVSGTRPPPVPRRGRWMRLWSWVVVVQERHWANPP